MGFFQNLKWFVEGMHDANKELAQGLRNDLKGFKTDMKDITKQYYPKVGNAIETVDRASQTVQNFIDANNPVKILVREFSREKEPTLADHLCVQRLGFTHHGIYVGGEMVIHFSDDNVQSDSLDYFKGVSTLSIIDTPISYSTEIAVSRARSKLGESSYNVFSNNCEHFVIWCRSGGKYSDSI